MLIKLGKYLRILGFDTVWDSALRTHELIKLANAEDRVFLTRNSRLPHQYPVPLRVQRINSTDPVSQLREVVLAAGLDPNVALFTKCIRCNVGLNAVQDRESVRAAVHANVFDRFDEFYRCPHCQTVFWKGSHVRNTCRKLAPVLETG